MKIGAELKYGTNRTRTQNHELMHSRINLHVPLYAEESAKKFFTKRGTELKYTTHCTVPNAHTHERTHSHE